MAFKFKFKIGFVYYCLCCLVVRYSKNQVTASFEIVRGKIDTFKNLECQKEQKQQHCTSDQCKSYRAECEDEECKRCQCSENGRGTFLASGSNTGNCTNDENIIPESVPKESFRLQKTVRNTKTNKCLTVADENNYNISGKNCTSSLNMHWIWIETRVENENKTQLMNVLTLQCLEFLTSTLLCTSKRKNQTGGVGLKQCKRTDGQYITVHENSNTILYECRRRRYHLLLKNDQNKVEYLAFIQRNVHMPDRWTNSEKDDLRLYKRHITTYKAIKRAEKILLIPTNFLLLSYDAGKCSVEWSESRIMYGGPEWQNVSQDIDQQLFSIERKSDDIKILKVDQKAIKLFNGSLLKLSISCKYETDIQVDHENHCLLLKFKSLDCVALKTQTKPSSPPISKAISTASTEVKIENEDSEESSINTVAIAVPISTLAAIFVLSLVYFMCYRKRYGHAQSEEEYRQNRDQNQPSTLEESAVLVDPLQPSSSNQSTQRESQHYETTCEHPYEYVVKTAIVPSKTFTYDYAFVDGPLKNNHGTKVKLGGTDGDDYVIKNDGKMMPETHDDYVVRDELHVSVIEPRSEIEHEETHNDYVVRDKSYVTVIQPRPETKDEETHDDYVVRDESHVSVIEPRPEIEHEETHDDYAVIV